MPALPTYQARKFGNGSTVTLATKGGAVLGGIWISTKATAPNIAVFDGASTGAAVAMASTAIPVVTGPLNFPPFETGTGLTVKTLSCTGTIYWRPGAAGGV